MDINAWPSEGYDFGQADLAPVTGGMVVRSAAGNVRPGVISSHTTLVKPRVGEFAFDVLPCMVVRADGPRAMIGGIDELTLVSIQVPPATNARIDVIYARPQDVGAGDPAGTLFVITGTPSAAPVKPGGIPSGGVEIATILVPATATSSANCTITVTAQQTSMAGGTIRFASAAERDAFAGIEGQLGLVGSTLYQRTGSSWTAVVPPIPVLPKVVKGVVTARAVAAGGSTPVVITFPAGSFTAPPNVQVTKTGNARDTTVGADLITKDGFTVRLDSTSITGRTIGAHWRAEQ